MSSAHSSALQLKLRGGETRSRVPALTQVSSHLYEPSGNAAGHWSWCQTEEKGNKRRKGKNHQESARCQKTMNQNHSR